MKISNTNKKEKGLFLVNTLAIIFDTTNKKILIAKRKKDPEVEKLTWSFPGTRPHHNQDLEKSLERAIKRKTGLKVKNLGAIFSRIPRENKNFILIYYLCEKISGKEKPKEDFIELKWVKPQDLEKYFKTSFDKRLKEYICNLK